MVFAVAHLSAVNVKVAAFDDALGQYFSCTCIYGLNGGTCNLHLVGTLFLRQPLKVDQADGLVFINGHDEGFFTAGIGAESGALRSGTHPSVLLGSWHGCTSCYRHMSRISITPF